MTSSEIGKEDTAGGARLAKDTTGLKAAISLGGFVSESSCALTAHPGLNTTDFQTDTWITFPVAGGPPRLFDLRKANKSSGPPRDDPGARQRGFWAYVTVSSSGRVLLSSKRPSFSKLQYSCPVDPSPGPLAPSSRAWSVPPRVSGAAGLP